VNDGQALSYHSVTAGWPTIGELGCFSNADAMEHDRATRWLVLMAEIGTYDQAKRVIFVYDSFSLRNRIHE